MVDDGSMLWRKDGVWKMRKPCEGQGTRDKAEGRRQKQREGVNGKEQWGGALQSELGEGVRQQGLTLNQMMMTGSSWMNRKR